MSSPRAGALQATGPAANSLLNRVANRPAYLPSQVVAKVDTSAIPTRLVVVAKTGLPAGSSLDSATGDITVPLGVTVTGIAGITLDGGAFANGGQFTAAGTTLRISPRLMTEPAVGDTDTYAVTLNNLGGGTTLVTVVVTRGSVRIGSILVAAGNQAPLASDATADAAFNNFVTVDFASLVSDDVTGDAQLVFELVTDGSPTGLLVSGSFPVLTFTKNYNGTNWSGNTFITYRVRDAGGLFSSVQRVDILNVDGAD